MVIIQLIQNHIAVLRMPQKERDKGRDKHFLGDFIQSLHQVYFFHTFNSAMLVATGPNHQIVKVPLSSPSRIGIVYLPLKRIPSQAFARIPHGREKQKPKLK